VRPLSAGVVGLAGALLLPVAAGCSSDGAVRSDDALTVYAAASLTATFERIGDEFEARHEGVTVDFSFAGSSDLVAQIQEGAPADVLATADEATMDRLVADGLEGATPRLFASNTLRIAVPPGNPAGVADLRDLAGEGLDVVVCAPEVPCGAAARTVAAAAGVELRPVSEEQSVTDVAGKVRTGEADAGLVYLTDVVAAAGELEGVDFPESGAAVNGYPIAPVAGGNASLAREFVDLVLGETGQAVLREAGFAPAP
jgi:molybdate transport system substrate-binding protein